MSRKTRGLLITSVALMLVGIIIFGGTMSMINWNYTLLSTSQFENEEVKVTGEIKNVKIIAKTADVVFMAAPTDEASVILNEQKNMKHTVTLSEGTLTVEVKDTRKWYEYIGINFKTPKITVLLPMSDYGELSVKTTTGKVELPDEFCFERADITVTTGSVTLGSRVLGAANIKSTTGSVWVENTTLGSLSVSLSTGNVNLKYSSCAESLKVNVSTGRVRFVDFDAADITVETDTGDIIGNLLTPKQFDAKTATGRVSVPQSEDGGSCKLTTDTGDINITVG